ncbi:Putative major facilitator, sugar transporter, major facilitator superfamily [Septoria linicola]|uniref:Major facilitator, sugar transporter, major facilitator superfamily n=1 Tax=Septoria linicola TaxID=215465 RepID=A0A9Q9ERQ6_9PEZI|nr:Putative major facilitator, sugar transporter, major facilitator superfamily [Septoria linicola]
MATLTDEKKQQQWTTHQEDVEEADLKKGIYDEQSALSSIKDTAASKAAWLITLTVSLGGFLFGYDTGYISSVLVSIGDSLGHELSSSEQELVTSLTSGGALVGAVFAGLSADKYGRKPPIWAARYHLRRFVVGLGVGFASMIVPLYIGERAPAKYRGRMVAFNNTSVTFGQLIASAIGAGLAEVSSPDA